MKTPGIILVSPAIPEMIIKALTTEKTYGSRPVANMIDFEDAFHLDIERVLEGQKTLREVKLGKASAAKQTTHEIITYSAPEDGVNLIWIRVEWIRHPADRGNHH